MYGDYDDDYEEAPEIGDYYCDLCDAHMNSVQMWESHITGKRHLKNMKKPGEPSKIKSVVRDDIPSVLMRLVRNRPEPIVGLGYMSELQRSEPGIDPTYTCYICHGTFTKSTVIPHLTSTKHRLNYIKAVDHSSFHAINSLKLTTAALDALVEEKSADWEHNAGRGTVEVKLEKPKNVSSVDWYYENKKYMSRREQPQILYSSSRSVKRESPRPSASRPPSSTALLRPSPSIFTRPPNTPSPSRPPPRTSSPRPASAPRDAPTASQPGSRTSPSSSSSAQASASKPNDLPVVKEAESKGITDIDLLRDIGMCSTEMQLELLDYLLVKEPPPVETDEMLQEAIEFLNTAKQVLLRWRVDRMSLEEQQKLVDAVVKQQEDPVYKQVFGPANMKK